MTERVAAPARPAPASCQTANCKANASGDPSRPAAAILHQFCAGVGIAQCHPRPAEADWGILWRRSNTSRRVTELPAAGRPSGRAFPCARQPSSSISEPRKCWRHRRNVGKDMMLSSSPFILAEKLLGAGGSDQRSQIEGPGLRLVVMTYCGQPVASDYPSAVQSDGPAPNLYAMPPRISLIGTLFPASAEFAATLTKLGIPRLVYRYSMRPKT